VPRNWLILINNTNAPSLISERYSSSRFRFTLNSLHGARQSLAISVQAIALKRIPAVSLQLNYHQRKDLQAHPCPVGRYPKSIKQQTYYILRPTIRFIISSLHQYSRVSAILGQGKKCKSSDTIFIGMLIINAAYNRAYNSPATAVQTKSDRIITLQDFRA
jgi:hypothetical protein